MDMSSAAFMSYARFDDNHNHGQLTKFRKELSGEVRAHTGVPFDIFQDTSDIRSGQDWKGQIDTVIDECALFMPVLSPSYLASASCRDELQRVIARESKLGRKDLILPIYYITCPEGHSSPEINHLVKVMGERNYCDLREVRGRPLSLRLFRTKLTELAKDIIAGLKRSRAAEEEAAAAVLEICSRIGQHSAYVECMQKEV